MSPGRLFPDLDMVPSKDPPAQQHSATSIAAAEQIKQRTVLARAQVLDALQRAGADGLTDQEIEHATWLSGNSVRPRRGELVEAGLVRDSGRTRKTTSGRAAVVWRITEQH